MESGNLVYIPNRFKKQNYSRRDMKLVEYIDSKGDSRLLDNFTHFFIDNKDGKYNLNASIKFDQKIIVIETFENEEKARGFLNNINNAITMGQTFLDYSLIS